MTNTLEQESPLHDVPTVTTAGTEQAADNITISRELLKRCRDAIGTTNLEGEDELLADLDRELEQK